MARLIDGIFGHDEIWRRLTALRQSGRLPHALAFTGPSGVGKRRVAWALAQALLCERGADAPCGSCGSCLRVDSGSSESVLALEPSGGQIKLEAARQVTEFLSLRRLFAARLVIVDGAQSLNPQAANALLKIVEEPPPATHFVLIVPEISQLLPTLRSRSQVLRFQPLAAVELAKIAAAESANGPGGETAAWKLRSARGSCERLAAFEDEETDEWRRLAFDFLRHSVRGERAGLDAVSPVIKDRDTALQLVRFLQQGLRDWTVSDIDGAAIHTDQTTAWTQLPRLEPRAKIELWLHAQRMESDLNGNVDRGLLFENFFYRAGMRISE
jgi:DNA polymerase-3 subunit delta'